MAGPASSLDVLEVLEAVHDARKLLEDISARLLRVEKFLKLDLKTTPSSSREASQSCRGSFESPADSPRSSGAWVLRPEEYGEDKNHDWR